MYFTRIHHVCMNYSKAGRMCLGLELDPPLRAELHFLLAHCVLDLGFLMQTDCVAVM